MQRRIFSSLICFAIIFNYASAQIVKEKTKEGKTKIKEETNSSLNNNNKQPTVGLLNNSLANTSWKFFLAEPINDTSVWRFTNDSSIVQNKMGEVLVYGLYTQSHDTLSFHDLGGRYHCPEVQEGKYKITFNNDWLTLDFIDDDCLGRAGILDKAKLQRSHLP